MKKKGFTLIELLAVIIILAVIALIATPIVLDVIEDSKKSASKSAAALVLDSAKLYYAEQYFKQNGSFSEYECTISNKSGCDELSIGGERPDTAIITINKEGKVSGKVEFGDYTYYYCNSVLSETESSECPLNDYELIYAITTEGIITGFKTVSTTAYNIVPKIYASELTEEAQNYINGKEIIIPEYIGEIEVKGIASNAFLNYEIESVIIFANKEITIGENAFPATLNKLKVSSCYADKYTTYESILETITMNCGTQNTPVTPTYAAYSVGDDVTLIDGTTWVVIKDTTTDESEIKLMATSNIHPNLTNETGTAMFLRSGYELGYDSNYSNVWATSTLKAYLDSTVKTRLEASLNTTISDITIWGAEELTALGCTVTGNETDGYSAVSCDDTKAWYSKVFKNTSSWTKLPRDIRSYNAWCVVNSGLVGEGDVRYGRMGARPVITVSKSVISQ